MFTPCVLHVIASSLVPQRISIPVRENTSAVITRNFVTGIAQIRLVTPEPAGPPLASVPDDEPFPLITEGASDVAEITGRVTELGDMAADTMQRLSQSLSLENRNNAAATLANLRELTDRLKGQLVGVDTAVTEIGAAGREFRRAAALVATATERVGERAGSTLDDSRLLVADLRATADEAKRAISQAAAAITAMQAQAEQTSRRIDASAAHLDEQLLIAVSDLRISLEAMQRTLDRLVDPRAALLGPDRSRLGPGEKLP